MTEQQRTPPRQVRYVRYRAPNGLLIAGSADTMAVTTHIAVFAIGGESEMPEAIYDGYTDHGDTTEAIVDEEGRDVYVDEHGNEWSLDDCTWEDDKPDDRQRLYYEHIHLGHTRGPRAGCDPCQRAPVCSRATAIASVDELTAVGWSRQDAEAAETEGWNIWLANGEPPEVERDDHGHTPFATDNDAILHVVDHARNGSELHRRALRIHLDGNGA